MDPATKLPGQAAATRNRAANSEIQSASRPPAKRQAPQQKAWPIRLWREAQERVRYKWRLFRNDTPLEQCRRVLVVLFLMGGGVLLLVLAWPTYDRALTLTGRTEVLSMRLDNPAFGRLDFDSATVRFDQDNPELKSGPMQLDVSPETRIRFTRIGRGPLLLTFAADQHAGHSDPCTAGLHQAGQATIAGVAAPLCEGAVVAVQMAPGDGPLVVGLSGELVIGEEVGQGAGPRPILLDATASLLVKHGGKMFRDICTVGPFEHLCDRFVANSLVLSPGNSVRAFHHGKSIGADGHGSDGHDSVSGKGDIVRPQGFGFLRVDPNELYSGMLFNMAAQADAFEVTRIEGETFSVRENSFEVIEKSPLVHSLNVLMATVGLLWYFLRLGRREGEEKPGAAAVLACVLLGAPAPARAQQALLRADETGQALLRARGDRCYAVTPAHVMGQETAALVTAPGRERGEGDLLRRIPAAPEPVALLTLRGVPLSLCPAFEGVVYLDRLLRDRSAAVLRLVRPDGSIDRVPLLLTSVEVETVEVRTEEGATLEQGMSGGTVLVGDQPAGMLVDVLDGGRTGRVARLDRVFERLAPHLGGQTLAAVLPSQPTAFVPYDIVRSNAVPVSPANRASNLQGEGSNPWRVSAAGRVELVLRLGGAISGVTLDLTGLDDPPNTVELLAGRTEVGPWQSVASLSLEAGDKARSGRFPTISLPYVLLRNYSLKGQDTLALRRVTFAGR